MKLTGKCKEDFEKWYFKNHCKTSLKYEELMPHHKEDVYGWFYGIDLSFQYGVYVDFFDSVGVYISDMVDCYHSSRNKPQFSMSGFSMCIEGNGFCNDIDNFKIRQEARIKAIEKANEIYNERQRTN